MSNHQHLLDHLFATGHIRIQRSALFDAQPVPLPPTLTWDRIAGMLPGLAIGGAYRLETVSKLLYLLMQHSHNPEEALIRAVNDTRDNDTVAAIVGAAVARCTEPLLFQNAGVPDCWAAPARMTMGEFFALLQAARAS